jgi:hypothetical protein
VIDGIGFLLSRSSLTNLGDKQEIAIHRAWWEEKAFVSKS